MGEEGELLIVLLRGREELSCKSGSGREIHLLYYPVNKRVFIRSHEGCSVDFCKWRCYIPLHPLICTGGESIHIRGQYFGIFCINQPCMRRLERPERFATLSLVTMSWDVTVEPEDYRK